MTPNEFSEQVKALSIHAIANYVTTAKSMPDGHERDAYLVSGASELTSAAISMTGYIMTCVNAAIETDLESEAQQEMVFQGIKQAIRDQIEMANAMPKYDA